MRITREQVRDTLALLFEVFGFVLAIAFFGVLGFIGAAWLLWYLLSGRHI